MIRGGIAEHALIGLAPVGARLLVGLTLAGAQVLIGLASVGARLLVGLTLTAMAVFPGAAATLGPADESDSYASIHRRLRDAGPCRIDLEGARALLDSLDPALDLARDPARDRLIFDTICALADLLDGSPCLLTCRPWEVDPRALSALRALQDAALRYYREPQANPLFRMEALWKVTSCREGPEIWRTGLETLATYPLSLPDGENWEQMWAEARLSERLDPESVTDPAYVLWVGGTRHLRYDKRLAQAASEVTFLWPDSVRACYDQEERQRTPHPAWVEHCILGAAEELVRGDLSRYLDRHDRLPSAVADAEGRPLPEVLPSLVQADAESTACNARLACWFLGWPGFRLSSYDAQGRICTIEVEGYGLESRDLWGFWFE